MGQLNIFKIPHIKVQLFQPVDDKEKLKETYQLLQTKDERFISSDRKYLRDIASMKWFITNTKTNERFEIYKTGDYQHDVSTIRKGILNMEEFKEKRSKRNSRVLKLIRYGMEVDPNEKEILKKVADQLNKQPYNTPKKPLLSCNYIGLELEFGHEYTEAALAEYFKENKLNKFIEFKRDGSIRTSLNQIEIACCIPEVQINKIHDICKLITSKRYDVNPSCGLHVHIDMRNRDYGTVMKRFLNMENILYSMVTKERRSNTYCQRNSSLTLEQMRGNRRLFLNITAYNKHKTFEIRLHHGTLDSSIIVSWVKLLTLIADTPQKDDGKLYSSYDEMINYVSFDNDTLTFIQNEMRKYQ